MYNTRGFPRVGAQRGKLGELFLEATEGFLVCFGPQDPCGLTHVGAGKTGDTCQESAQCTSFIVLGGVMESHCLYLLHPDFDYFWCYLKGQEIAPHTYCDFRVPPPLNG